MIFILQVWQGRQCTPFQRDNIPIQCWARIWRKSPHLGKNNLFKHIIHKFIYKNLVIIEENLGRALWVYIYSQSLQMVNLLGPVY